MNSQNTKRIDAYLSGTMSPDELTAFETDLIINAELREELEVQKDVASAVQRSHDRLDVESAKKRYKNRRLLKFAGLISVVLVSTFTLISLNRNTSNTDVSINELAPISQQTKRSLDTNQCFDNVPIQYFQVPSQGSFHLSKQGVLISVPSKAFMKDGKPYEKNVILQYQEAIKGVDIITSGLSTMTGNDLLETQGMFSVAGYTEDGEILEFNPEVGVYLQSPVDECKKDMRLYDGKTLADGSIDWVNPQPMSKIPVPVDMSELDFYPTDYEPYLDELCWSQAKVRRDSLYLSLEHSLNTDEIRAMFNIQSSDSIDESDVSESFEINEREKGMVFLSEKRDKATVIKIDDAIAWDFFSEKIGKNKYRVTATAIIHPDFHLYPAGSREEDALQLILDDSPLYKAITPTKNNDLPGSVSTRSGTKRAYRNEASFSIEIEKFRSYSMSIPVRVIFKIGTKEIDYNRALRGKKVYMGQTREEQEAMIDSLNSYQFYGNFVSPSKVLGFWNDNFNNTNLATREFEERMPVIHASCSDEVLEMYTKGLNRSISDIDKQLVQMGYNEFKAFENQQIGKVDIDDPHMANLMRFYEISTNALRNDAKQSVENEEERLKRWAEFMTKQRDLEKKRSARRNETYVDELSNFDRKRLIRQFGESNGFKITEGSFGSPIARRNCDRWIPLAAASLPELRIHDNTYRYASIDSKDVFKNFEAMVPNYSKYIKLYMYVFADELNSYQRIDGTNGYFECGFNTNKKYSVGFIGITENGFEYSQSIHVKPGNFGNVKLQPISQAELEATIKKLNDNRILNMNAFGDVADIRWLAQEVKTYKEKALLQEKILFRRDVKLKIFPCLEAIKTEEITMRTIE